MWGSYVPHRSTACTGQGLHWHLTSSVLLWWYTAASCGWCCLLDILWLCFNGDMERKQKFLVHLIPGARRSRLCLQLWALSKFLRTSYEMFCTTLELVAGTVGSKCPSREQNPSGQGRRFNKTRSYGGKGQWFKSWDFHQALTQLSCKKAGKSLMILKKDIEMSMTRIMFVAAGTCI